MLILGPADFLQLAVVFFPYPDQILFVGEETKALVCLRKVSVFFPWRPWLGDLGSLAADRVLTD